MSATLHYLRERAPRVLERLVLSPEGIHEKLTDALQLTLFSSEWSELSDISKEPRRGAAELLGIDGWTTRSDLLERVRALSDQQVEKLTGIVAEGLLDIADEFARADEAAAA